MANVGDKVKVISGPHKGIHGEIIFAGNQVSSIKRSDGMIYAVSNKEFTKK